VSLGVAIIGPGLVAHTHAQALEQIDEAKLVAVCGRDENKTRAFAQCYGARDFTSLEQMLEHPGVDAVIIATPHPLHAEQTVLAANAGKHVLLEKPMALTVADCDLMIAAARAHRVKLGIISQRRLYEPVMRVKNALLEGKLGRPLLATLSLLGWRGPEYYAMADWRGTWAGEGGGVLVNQAVHQLDLLTWLMGPVRRVSSEVANLNHPEIEVEDTAVVVIRFQSGALGSIVASNSQNPGLWGRIQVHGSNGASVGVQTDGGSMFVAGVTRAVEAPINDLWTIPGESHLLEAWQNEDRARAASLEVMTHYHTLQIQDFVHAILSDRDPMVTGEDGRNTVGLIEAIYRSGSFPRPAILPNT
jgi:UDP-N-acetyl-2-amino-2-deoxyglucuronate dehydrogenase